MAWKRISWCFLSLGFMLALELLVVILFQDDFKGGPKLSCSGKCVRVMFLSAAGLVWEWLLRLFVSQYHLFSTYTIPSLN